MKKSFLLLMGGVLIFGASCTSTTTENGTATTAETTTDATAGGATSPGAAVTGTSSTTAGAGTDADVTTVTDLNDPTFIMTAASANMLEIEAGRLAVQNANNADVKQYGQMMIDHHTMANQELQAIARQLNTEMPTVLLPPHQAMLDKVKGKTGTAFDEDFMDMMEASHKMTIAMFEAKSNNAQNASVKAYATKTLPTLRTHLESATRIEDMVD